MVYSEIIRMQVRAEGIDVAPEIMVPLVALGAQASTLKELIQTVADETMVRYEMRFSYHVALCANCLAPQ